ncbi:MAG: ribosomal protein S18-alanine N-acetyltransferase [Candidatus Acidiferrales bacterium]
MERTLSGVAGKIRSLEARDIDQVLEIQTRCREASQWSRKDYEALAGKSAPCFIAENDGGVIGFLIARKLADDMEVLNLAVAPAAQRQGIAGQLLLEAMKWGATNGITKVHLEVRASNAAARAFYQSRGFHVTGTRPNYYRDPVDDAALLTATVNNQ